MPEQCQENYSNLVSTVVAVGVLIFSEILPFIKAFEGNGVVHGIVKVLSDRFPVNHERLPINP
jgi:hypothetical protein